MLSPLTPAAVMGKTLHTSAPVLEREESPESFTHWLWE